MQTRSLKLRLQRLIDERYKNLKLHEIGENLGLASEVTVRKYLRDEALTLDREVLEKACDWLNVDMGQLLELVPCDFAPHGDRLLRLCSKEDGRDDYGALSELTKLFSDVNIETKVLQDPVELARQVYERDCVIIGSPHHNIAGEIALCTLFSTAPGNTSDENRRKLPLMIEAPTAWQRENSLVKNIPATSRVPQQCRAMMAASGEKSPERTFEKKSSCVTADFHPLKDFQQVSFEKAKDFGIILVADHWVGDDRKVPVRTYWLSGFSNVGILASLLAVKDNVRIFSLDTPQDKPGEFILSIVQATSRKKKGSLYADLNDDYEIVEKIRGSLPFPVQVPIDHGKNKPPDLRVPPQSATPSLHSVRTRQPRRKT